MDEREIQIIKNNIPELVNKTQYKLLAEKCIERGIITKKMLNVIQRQENGTSVKFHHDLFIKITHRGPNAFPVLVDICAENFPSAKSILVPTTSEETNKQSNNEFFLDSEDLSKIPVFEKITIPDKIINDNLDNTDENDNDVVVGVLLLVHYTVDRPKANEEIQRIKSLFYQLNFKIFFLENKPIKYVHEKIIELKQHKHLEKAKCFFYIHLGHGTVSELYFMDYAIKSSRIVDAFNHKNCGSLYNRQKVFIFPSNPFIGNAIKDDLFSFGNSDTKSIAEGSKSGKCKIIRFEVNIPTRCDNIFFYLEIDDKSFEESIKVFARCIAEYAYKEPLQNIIKLYFDRRKRTAHSDYREIVEEGCRKPFYITYMGPIKKAKANMPG